MLYLWANPFLAGKLMSQNFKQFNGHHFETVCPIFHFFAAFRFVCLFVFWVLYQGFKFQCKICSEKCVFWVWVHMDPLDQYRHTEDLDHVSVNYAPSGMHIIMSLPTWNHMGSSSPKLCTISSFQRCQSEGGGIQMSLWWSMQPEVRQPYPHLRISLPQKCLVWLFFF